MRTEAEIKKEIQKLEEQKQVYELNGGGGLHNPYPFDDIINFLKWTMEEAYPKSTWRGLG